jgi:ATP-binding cassette subfamily B multidrug efflux pump
MNSIRKLLPYLKPYRHWALIAPLLMMLEVAMDLMQPRLVQRIVDEGIAQLDLNLVIGTGLLMIGLAVLGAFGGMSNGVFAELTSQGFGADLRESLFGKVQSLSFANLDQLETGNLITRLTNDVTQVQEAIVMVLRMLVRAPFLLVGSLLMAVITSPQLAWLPLALIPIELVLVIWVVKTATPLYAGVQERLDTLNGVLQENLAGVRVVKAFVRASHEIARFGAANEDLVRQTVRAGRTVAVVFPYMMMTMNLGIAAVLWFGGIQVTRGNMHVGQIIAFVNYLTTTLFSLMMVSQLVIQMARAEASAERIQEVLESQPLVQNRPWAWKNPEPLGRVEFRDVSFRYNGNGNASGPVGSSADQAAPARDGSEAVLRRVSFTAEPGQTVALLGSTGVGKSSLVHLIPRFYDVSAGSVLIDGADVRDLDQEALRRSVGMALQEVVLFSGTIRDNIRYGRPEASEEQVVAAAKIAQAHDFIVSFPEGYDTLVGQRGANLSGGQKQRIAIARALLIDPSILILDDSTSAVDVETESKIQAALEAIRPRTSFVIAQRISTVLNADQILVLEGGRLVAQGSHRQLLQTSPIYRDIYESQLGGDGSAERPAEVSHE